MNPVTTTQTPATAAPEVEAPKPAKPKPAPVTTRKLWLIAYAITAVATVLRVLSLRDYVAGEIVRQDVLREVNDPRLEKLAVNTGYLMAVLISLLVVWIFYSLASVMEKNIFRSARVGKLHFGLFFVVAFLTTFPVQVVCGALGVISPKDSVWYYLYVAVVGLGTPLLFRDGWRRLSRGRAFGVFAFSLVLAGLSIAA